MSEPLAPTGVFGGTFDPVHFGHLRLAQEAALALALESVRWVPAGQPALRESPQVSARQRLAMVGLAIAGNARFSLDSAEVDAAQTSYTVPTLERLRRADACGEARPLVLIVGADAFAGIVHWHRWQALLSLAHIAVAERPGSPLTAASLPAALRPWWDERHSASSEALPALRAAPAGRIVSFAMTQLDISATVIRRLLSNQTQGDGEASARYLVPDSVLSYIRANRLYQKGPSSQ